MAPACAADPFRRQQVAVQAMRGLLEMLVARAHGVVVGRQKDVLENRPYGPAVHFERQYAECRKEVVDEHANGFGRVLAVQLLKRREEVAVQERRLDSVVACGLRGQRLDVFNGGNPLELLLATNTSSSAGTFVRCLDRPLSVPPGSTAVQRPASRPCAPSLRLCAPRSCLPCSRPRVRHECEYTGFSQSVRRSALLSVNDGLARQRYRRAALGVGQQQLAVRHASLHCRASAPGVHARMTTWRASSATGGSDSSWQACWPSRRPAATPRPRGPSLPPLSVAVPAQVEGRFTTCTACSEGPTVVVQFAVTVVDATGPPALESWPARTPQSSTGAAPAVGRWEWSATRSHRVFRRRRGPRRLRSGKAASRLDHRRDQWRPSLSGGFSDRRRILGQGSSAAGRAASVFATRPYALVPDEGPAACRGCRPRSSRHWRRPPLSVERRLTRQPALSRCREVAVRSGEDAGRFDRAGLDGRAAECAE